MIEIELALQMKEGNQKMANIMQMKFDEYGMTIGLLYILKLIENNPNASQKELAKQMGFTQGAMSISVKKLMKLNMVEQIQLESDMRYNKLVVTGKGKKVMDDYQDYLYKIIRCMFNGFSEEELVKFYDFVLRVNKNLENINNENRIINLAK